MEKGLVLAGFLFLIIFSLGCSEDLDVVKAEQELRNIEGIVNAYETRFETIPTLELSENVKIDYEIEYFALATVEDIFPGVEMSTDNIVRLYKFYNARKSPNLSKRVTTPNEILSELTKLEDVMEEDLKVMERNAVLYSNTVSVLSLSSGLPNLSISRKDSTEEYFLDYEELKLRHDSMKMAVKNFSGDKVLRQVVELRRANKAFGRFIRFIVDMEEMGPINPALSELYPSLVNEEKVLEECLGGIGEEGQCSGAGAWEHVIHPLAGGLREEFENIRDW
ncbi:MAG: hypothetical protein ABH851_03510 [Methanobacteriota archaeon]